MFARFRLHKKLSLSKSGAKCTAQAEVSPEFDRSQAVTATAAVGEMNADSLFSFSADNGILP